MKKVYITAVFIAIIAGVATYIFATQVQKSTKIKDAPMAEVVVALQDIRENSLITEEMVELRTYTVASITPGAPASLDEVVGHLARYPIMQGEQVLPSKLIKLGERDEKGALSHQLLPGEYAYSLSIGSEQGVSGFIGRGDYVDILFTELLPDGEYKTDFVLRDIYVLRTSNYAANRVADAPDGQPITSYMEVTFKLDEAQCLLISNTLAKGEVRLILKSIKTGEELNADVKQTEAARQEPNQEETTNLLDAS